MNIKNKTAGHAGIACFSFALKGNRAGSPHFKIVRFKWWEHVTGNLYLILCDPGMHPIGSSVMRQSELDGAVKLGKRIVYVDELLDHIPESSPYVEN